MPQSKSAKKRMRSSAKDHERNKAARATTRTGRKAFDAAIASGAIKKGKLALDKYYAVLDKAAKKGAIHGNTARRRKSRAAKKLAVLSQHEAAHAEPSVAPDYQASTADSTIL